MSPTDKPKPLYSRIDWIAELGAICPSCGASSIAAEVRIGSFAPVVGMCYGRGHVWHIEPDTHAWMEWQSRKHEPYI